MNLKVNFVTNQSTSKNLTEALLGLIEKYEKEYPINAEKDKK